MTNESLKILRHIFDARIDNADDKSAYIAWTSARDIVEYALADNVECLRQYDYLAAKDDEKVDIDFTDCGDGFVAEIHSDEGFEAMMKLLFP